MDVASAAETGVFFLFAAITLGGALGLIFAQRVAHSMLSLIFCFMAVSGIFILLGLNSLPPSKSWSTWPVSGWWCCLASC